MHCAMEADLDDEMSPIKLRRKMTGDEFKDALTAHSGASAEAIAMLAERTTAKELLRSSRKRLFSQ